MFVAGDVGAARMQLPVARQLVGQGHQVDLVADGSGMAVNIFRDEKVDHLVLFSASPDKVERVTARCDLVFSGYSASAWGIEKSFVEHASSPVVLGSDGFFNHALPQWRDAQPGHWFAIDGSHAEAIRQLSSSPSRHWVQAVGQPAFDAVLELLPKKEDIRHQVRSALKISNDAPVLLWWSQGMAQVIEEDIKMLKAALDHCDMVFIPRIHPKLNQTVRQGYVDELRSELVAYARTQKSTVVSADHVPGEHLCLAADVIVSITCTEDIKNTMIGGPPVVHFLGPTVQHWMKTDLGLRHPYLPDVANGLSLGAFSVDEVLPAVRAALANPGALRQNWRPPDQPATERVAAALLALV